ncbi:hypothetical protein [Gaetbulibacter saemankumensis]|uniref:hypothetical protein n=1 Tax=Gaetbulibacter saemankumensis TaxID=311208 RepID=UPI0003FBBD69|nr:hypothetical protein [Gaetbulibacter saemankumensis]
MKKIFTLAIIIALSFSSFGQNHHERIKTLKIAYITEQLNLSEKEAQEFWPVYNTFEHEFFKLREELNRIRRTFNPDKLTEAEAKSILNDIKVIEDKKHILRIKNLENLSNIIPAKKVLLLKKAEDEFKHKMFEQYRKRMGQPRK